MNDGEWMGSRLVPAFNPSLDRYTIHGAVF
jgi:hypothetical protein